MATGPWTLDRSGWFSPAFVAQWPGRPVAVFVVVSAFRRIQMSG